MTVFICYMLSRITGWRLHERTNTRNVGGNRVRAEQLPDQLLSYQLNIAPALARILGRVAPHLRPGEGPAAALEMLLTSQDVRFDSHVICPVWGFRRREPPAFCSSV